MGLPQDIENYVLRVFGKEQFEGVMEVLRLAKLHDGREPNHRLVRCMLVASRGSLSGLGRFVDLLAIDYRDVIVSGEYESKDGDLVQVRDLSSPFSHSAA